MISDLRITGSHLARMPVDCRVGKMLIYASMFRCVTPIVRVAALMTCVCAVVLAHVILFITHSLYWFASVTSRRLCRR
jgi:hypothetical protein